VAPDDEPLPPPLPIRVRPATGETTESYIRRLARANHLRPSLLQAYVRSPGAPTGAIRLRRLAAASGTTPTALSRALIRLPPASEPRRPPPSPAESQAARKARLFGIIRDDAARGMSIRQIAGRHHVHRRMVRQAIAAPDEPPPRKQSARPARITGPVRDVLDELAGEPLTIREIWTTVVDEHDSDASYAAVRDYIRGRRLARQLGPPPDQVTPEGDLAPGRPNARQR
jgi:transposase